MILSHPASLSPLSGIGHLLLPQGHKSRSHDHYMASNSSCQLAHLIDYCITKKSLRLGKSIHAHILVSNLSPDRFLSNRLIELYAQCKKSDYAISVFNYIKEPNNYSWNAIFRAACKSNDLLLARQLFDQLPERNVVSWNTMISALVNNGIERDSIELYYTMLKQGYTPTRFTLASLLHAYGNLMATNGGMKCHGVSIKNGLDKISYVENALIGMYTRCGRVKDALKLFDEMLHPNEVSFTAMMNGLTRSGFSKEAFELFVKMHRLGVCIDQIAISSVLTSFSRAEDNELWYNNRSVQTLIIKKGFESDLHVGNSLMGTYTKINEMDNALLVFNALPNLSIVSWNILIAGYNQIRDSEKANQMFELMKKMGFEPDDVTYTSLIAVCNESRDIRSAHDMFDKMSKPNVASYNALLSGYCQEELHGDAIKLFRKMLSLNIRPDRITLSLILRSCSQIENLKFGKQINLASIRLNLDADMMVSSGLINMYSNCEYINYAKKVFDRMPERDIVTWNSMLMGLSLNSLNMEAFTLFKQMKQIGLIPTESTYPSVINSCTKLSSLKFGTQVHAQVIKSRYNDDVYVGTSLIDLYAKCGNINSARLLFDNMPKKNIISWNEMIHGYAQNGFPQNTLEVFDEMLDRKVKPDVFTFISILTACSRIGFINLGIKYFNSMQNEFDIKPILEHYTCMLDLLGRSGKFKDIEIIMQKMPFQDDPIIWELILNACVVHNNLNLGKYAAGNLFRIDAFNPLPYVLLANIYSGLGRYEDAKKMREFMVKRGIVKSSGYSWVDQKDHFGISMVGEGSCAN